MIQTEDKDYQYQTNIILKVSCIYFNYLLDYKIIIIIYTYKLIN